MNKKEFITKNTGDQLSAEEWNELTGYTNDIVDAVNAIGPTPTPSGDSAIVVTNDTQTGGDPAAGVSVISGVDQVGTAKVIELTKKKKGVNTTIVSGNNINIEPRESVDSTKGGNISFKPGDDIEFCSHHRLAANHDEVSVKVIDGDDNPVKLQLNAAEVTLTTKDKLGDNANVMDINVNSGKDTKGYLKVRAQAIDLRCEDHGGVAIQPKGEDSQHHMNKIKFEHGGGDGLEFGTFNTEKTSIFTDEYRFNKEGVWKMATRETEESDKYDTSDETTHYKYVKQSDDFYDIVSQDDEQCTTRDIIRTAYAMNGADGVHTKITNKGNLEIETSALYEIVDSETTATTTIGPYNVNGANSTIGVKLDEDTLLSVFNQQDKNEVSSALDDLNVGDVIEINYTVTTYGGTTEFAVKYLKNSPSINIESAAGLKLKGILDFGSTFNFGETDNGIEFLHKMTKKNAEKKCDLLKVVATNNSANAYTTNAIYPVDDPDDASGDGYAYAETPATIQPGESSVIAEVSVYDICKLVSYFKNNEQGPWAAQS